MHSTIIILNLQRNIYCMELENLKAQMRKGVLELCVLMLMSKNEVYASDIINKLRQADLLVVEGTLYPLLTRLKNDGLLEYKWIESTLGPPRKYYSLTPKGKQILQQAVGEWEQLVTSVTACKLM